MHTRRTGLVAMFVSMFSSFAKAQQAVQAASGAAGVPPDAGRYEIRTVTDFGLTLPLEATVTFTIGTEAVKLTGKEILAALRTK